MKIGIFTGGASVRSKNIFTAISRYPTGKHEIILHMPPTPISTKTTKLGNWILMPFHRHHMLLTQNTTVTAYHWHNIQMTSHANNTAYHKCKRQGTSYSKIKVYFGKVRKFVREGKDACFHLLFLIFPQFFQKSFFLRVIESRDCVVKGLMKTSQYENVALVWQRFLPDDFKTLWNWSYHWTWSCKPPPPPPPPSALSWSWFWSQNGEWFSKGWKHWQNVSYSERVRLQ